MFKQFLQSSLFKVVLWHPEYIAFPSPVAFLKGELEVRANNSEYDISWLGIPSSIHASYMQINIQHRPSCFWCIFCASLLLI